MHRLSLVPALTCTQVCLGTVGVLSDLITNVGPELEPYCDEIMQLLIVNLGSNDVHRTIKPQV
jgi:importin subunit beta-1